MEYRQEAFAFAFGAGVPVGTVAVNTWKRVDDYMAERVSLLELDVSEWMEGCNRAAFRRPSMFLAKSSRRILW